MRTRGVSLIELLISLTIVLVITGAMARAYVASIDYSQKLRSGRTDISIRQSFETRLSSVLKRAYVSADANDTASYFLGGNAAQTTTAGEVSNSASNNASGTDTITFTALASRVSGAVLDSEGTFEENNQKIGPTGGITEYSISLSSVGENPDGKTGMFIRKQTPADGDPTQGGRESVFEENIDQISFEYFDGTQWLTDWDTRTQTTRRLPSVVRVTYRFTGDENDHILFIRIPLSDVTPTNPITEAGA